MVTTPPDKWDASDWEDARRKLEAIAAYTESLENFDDAVFLRRLRELLPSAIEPTDRRHRHELIADNVALRKVLYDFSKHPAAATDPAIYDMAETARKALAAAPSHVEAQDEVAPRKIEKLAQMLKAAIPPGQDVHGRPLSSTGTPRTDALLDRIDDMIPGISLADFARQLEREGITARTELVNLVKRPASAIGETDWQARALAAEAKLNAPELHSFRDAVVLEAAHQRERWGTDHDGGKQPEDWLWLVAYLATKAGQAHRYGDREKYLHHIVTCGAACANWHAHALGANTEMRPGVDPAKYATSDGGGKT